MSNLNFSKNESNKIEKNEADIGGITLKDLYTELERKDLVIQHLQSQLLSTQTQSDILLTTKKDELSLKETNLRTQLSQRDQILQEKERLIQSLQGELNNAQKVILEKKEENEIFKQDIEEGNIKIKNIQLRLNAQEDENKKNKIDYENKINLLQKEKKAIEAKTAQLVEIIKQYSKELSDYSIHIESIEAEKKSLNSLNKMLNEKNDENMKTIQKYKIEIEKINNLFKENQDLRQNLTTIQTDYEEERCTNEKLQKEIKNNEMQIMELTSKCAEFASLQKSYNELSKDYITLKSDYNQLEINNNINQNRANDCENELSTLSISINNALTNLVEWVETYFGIYYEYDIPKIPSITINNIKLDKLYDCLAMKRNKINDSMEQYEKANKDNNTQIRSLLEKIEKLQNDNKELNVSTNNIKKDLISHEEQKMRFMKENEDKDNIINDLKIQNESIYNAKNELLKIIDSTMKNGINTIINNSNNNILKLCDCFTNKNNYSYSNQDESEYIIGEISKVFAFINLLTNEYLKMISVNENMKNEFNISNKALNEQISRIRNESEQQNKENQITLSNISKDNSILQENIKFLEKKIKGLQTEMELKDMQIKSQEQIISRRNKKQNDNSSNISSLPDDTVIKSLQTEKEKLIMDNILLINDNKYLKEQLDKMQKEFLITPENRY